MTAALAGIDFLVDVAAELPMQTICILLGVPQEDRHALFAAVEPVFDIQTGDTMEGPWPRVDMFDYIQNLIASKAQLPRVLGELSQAAGDGVARRLTAGCDTRIRLRCTAKLVAPWLGARRHRHAPPPCCRARQGR